MANTILERVRGEDVEVIASTAAASTDAISNWTKVSIGLEIKEDDATAASAGHEQFTVGKKKLTGTLEGFVGGGESMPELPQPGDEIKTLSIETVTEGGDLVGDLSSYGKVVVTKTNYDQASDAGKYVVNFRSGAVGVI